MLNNRFDTGQTLTRSQTENKRKKVLNDQFHSTFYLFIKSIKTALKG